MLCWDRNALHACLHSTEQKAAFESISAFLDQAEAQEPTIIFLSSNKSHLIANVPGQKKKKENFFLLVEAAGILPPGWLDLKEVKCLHKVSWQQFPSVWALGLA